MFAYTHMFTTLEYETWNGKWEVEKWFLIVPFNCIFGTDHPACLSERMYLVENTKQGVNSHFPPLVYLNIRSQNKISCLWAVMLLVNRSSDKLTWESQSGRLRAFSLLIRSTWHRANASHEVKHLQRTPTETKWMLALQITDSVKQRFLNDFSVYLRGSLICSLVPLQSETKEPLSDLNILGRHIQREVWTPYLPWEVFLGISPPGNSLHSLCYLCVQYHKHVISTIRERIITTMKLKCIRHRANKQ